MASRSRGLPRAAAREGARRPRRGVRGVALGEDAVAVLAGLEQQRGPAVGEGVAGERLRQLAQVAHLPAGGARRALAGDHEHPVVLAGADQGLSHLDGVEHRVAGVLDVEDRAARPQRRGDDVRGGRLHEVLRRRREEQQVDVPDPEPLVGEQLPRRRHREVRGLPVVRHHVPSLDPGRPQHDPRWRPEPAALGRDPRLALRTRCPARRQVGRHPRDPCAPRACRTRPRPPPAPGLLGPGPAATDLVVAAPALR